MTSLSRDGGQILSRLTYDTDNSTTPWVGCPQKSQLERQAKKTFSFTRQGHPRKKKKIQKTRKLKSKISFPLTFESTLVTKPFPSIRTSVERLIFNRCLLVLIKNSQPACHVRSQTLPLQTNNLPLFPLAPIRWKHQFSFFCNDRAPDCFESDPKPYRRW